MAGWTTAATAIVLVAALLGGGYGTLLAAAPNGAASNRVLAVLSGPALTHRALVSMQQGDGPVPSRGWECTPTDPTSARCSEPPEHLTALPSWFNVTGNIADRSATNLDSVLPVNAGGSTLAYDPLLSKVVLWLGCSAGRCPDDETWEYDGTGWQNLTATLPTSPSPRSYPGFDFDPLLSGVVLVGGFGVGGTGLGDTWLFNGQWTNITSTAGSLKSSGGTPLTTGVGAPSVAWDPALHGLLLTDGCSDRTCRNTSWAVTDVLTAGVWNFLAPGPGASSGTELGFAAMAYDPIDGFMVEFGGWDHAAAGPEAGTYTYNGSGGWSNLTGLIAPSARDGAGITWDGQRGAILLVGGYNGVLGTFYNDSWLFVHGTWLRSTAVGNPAPTSFVPVFDPALAPNSTDVAPFLVGGLVAVHTNVYPDPSEWAWEVPPVPELTGYLPDPVDNASPATFTAASTPGTGSGPTVNGTFEFGDGNASNWSAPDVNGTGVVSAEAVHKYPAPGYYNATVVEQDFFTVGGTSAPINVSVNHTPVVRLFASESTTDVGAPVTFSAMATLGSPPYTFTWNFGDGSPPAIGPTVTHAFTENRSFYPNVTVTDTGAANVTFSLASPIVVNSPITARAYATPSTTRTNVQVRFNVTAAGGAGGNYSYAWEFADGSNRSVKPTAFHEFDSLGTYNVQVWVNDSVGGSVIASVLVTVSDATPTPVHTLNTGALELVLLVVVPVAVLVLVLALRRRPKRPPAPRGRGPPPPAGPPPGAVSPPGRPPTSPR